MGLKQQAMIRIFTLLLVGGLLIPNQSAAQNVTILDANFKAYLVGNPSINLSGDQEIQMIEARAFSGTINCAHMMVADLTGIEAFVNITELLCNNNQLTSLDVSQNTSLTLLNCSNNQLATLDVTSNTSLDGLYCLNYRLSSLNVTQNTNLTALSCSVNSLTTLDLTQNTLLRTLSCSSSQLTALDLTQNTALTYLSCSNNRLTTLDLTQNTLLRSLYCYLNQLTSLNLTPLFRLEFLECYNNQLTALDVTQNGRLFSLQCHSNQLTTLDVTQNTVLGRLSCFSNPLSTLDLSQNSRLNRLACQGTLMSSLTIKNGNNTNLTQFDARNNPNLTCIEVDDSTYAVSNWTNIDPTATFSTNCTVLHTAELPILTAIHAYPNPTTDQLHLDFGESHAQLNLQIINTIGQVVRNQTFTNQAQATLSLQHLAIGAYFIQLQTEEGIATLKVIKK